MLIEQTSFSAAYATVSPNPLIFIVAALFVLLTVKISIRKPVKMAAKVSPVEALRYTDSDTIKNGKKKKSIHSGNLQKRMAWENLGRNKKRTILVILSLSLSIVLTNTVLIFLIALTRKMQFKICLILIFALVKAVCWIIIR